MTSREKFEAWMTAEQWFHGSDFEWDERRNCYAQFGIHLAYKAFLAAEGAAEQKLTDMAVQLANAESKCRVLAAENVWLKNFIINDCHVAHIEPETFYEEEVTRYVSADGYESETTATDAFLAEVRAQGVEMAITVVNDCSNNICAGGLAENRQYEESIVNPYLDGIHDELQEIAAQLRKGATL